MNAPHIVQQTPGALSPRGSNPRTHSRRQIRQIAASIKRFGFTNPVLVDGAGGIIAGHGRVEAAKLLGLEAVPTLCIAGWSEAEIRAYVIADNKIAENAGWDRKLLALELQFLSELNLSIDLDVAVTGFEGAEIDILIGALGEDGDAADIAPVVDTSAPAVTQLGDLWAIGPHRLLCGDATKVESYAVLLGGDKAQMVFTDPPYNVPVDGHETSALAARSGSKQALLIDLLKRKGGATIEEAVAATGWQRHTVRGVISGALKKKLGLTVMRRANGRTNSQTSISTRSSTLTSSARRRTGIPSV